MLNYYCTWNAQNCARPDAVLEPSAEVFLGADGAKKARDYLDEDSIFGSGDLAGQFAPVRDQLYFLLDDGWDVPRGTHPVNDAAIESFGSLELARDRFPSFPGTPAQRLRGVNEALKARGWRGAGLWVSAQACGEGFVSGFWSREKSAEYWRTRLRWSREAGIGDWKVRECQNRAGHELGAFWNACLKNRKYKGVMKNGYVGSGKKFGACDSKR